MREQGRCNAPGQGHDRDEEDVHQGNKRAPGQHSSQLPRCGVRVIRVDDRYGDDHQPQDGSGRARACDEEAHIVAHHNGTLSAIGGYLFAEGVRVPAGS
jgi:hypothetical protein